MLLEIRSGTPYCEIFSSLNTLLIEFVQAAISRRTFSKSLFVGALQESIWDNTPTRKRFRDFWNELRKLNPTERADFVSYITSNQDLPAIFGDRERTFRCEHKELSAALSRLTAHLYVNTKDLVGVIEECGESVLESFNEFCRLNGRVCCFCATEELAQHRANIPDEAQWRSPYDHLIPKESYAIFGVHPQNLVPTCHTCNSKAKLSKQILFDPAGSRRVAFYPRNESAHGCVNLGLTTGPMGFLPVMSWIAVDAEQEEKLVSWSDVYQIKNRVEGKFLTFIQILDVDCLSEDFVQFREAVRRKSRELVFHVKEESWIFWKWRLYHFLDATDDGFLEEIWGLIQGKRDDRSYGSVYGI